ncbi:hypothetical protein FHG87_018434, partial [Trinorchestia longiramus]
VGGNAQGGGGGYGGGGGGGGGYGGGGGNAQGGGGGYGRRRRGVGEDDYFPTFVEFATPHRVVKRSAEHQPDYTQGFYTPSSSRHFGVSNFQSLTEEALPAAPPAALPAALLPAPLPAALPPAALPRVAPAEAAPPAPTVALPAAATPPAALPAAATPPAALPATATPPAPPAPPPAPATRDAQSGPPARVSVSDGGSWWIREQPQSPHAEAAARVRATREGEPRQRWDEHGRYWGRMYVIFPLEDLLEPYSVSDQRSTNQREVPQSHQQDNEPASSRPPPSPQPSHKTQPNQETSSTVLLTVPEETSSCASVTSDLKRSGSIRSSTAIDSPTDLIIEVPKIQEPPLAAAPSPPRTGFAKNFLKPPRLSFGRPSTPAVKKELSDQTLDRKSSPSPQQTETNIDESTKPKRTQALEKNSKKSDDSSARKPPKKSHSFSSIAPSYQALHIRRAVTPSDCETRLRPDSVAQETAGRQGSFTSIDKKGSTSGTLSVLSSDAASETSQVSYLSVRRGHCDDQLSSASVYRADSPLPSFSQRRKRAVVNVSVLPKDLGTLQKSTFIGAKDCSISAKEFSHNANASAVTIEEKEYCVHSKSEVGNENKDGFIRKNFFRDGGSIGWRQNVIRSESSVDSSAEATVTGSSVRSSNSSSTRSRASAGEVGPGVKASDVSSTRSKVHLHQTEQPFHRRGLGPFVKTSLDVSSAIKVGPSDVETTRVIPKDFTTAGKTQSVETVTRQSSDALATSGNTKRPAAPVRTLSTGAAPLGLDRHEGGRSPPQGTGSGAVSVFLKTAAAGHFSAVAAPSLPPSSPPRQLRPPGSGDRQRKSHSELPSKWTPPVGSIRSLSVSPKEKRPPWRGPQLGISDTGEAGLRNLTHPALNDPLRAHTNVTFKLIKTGTWCVQVSSKA